MSNIELVKSLFAVYTETDVKVAEAKAAYEQALLVRSESVKQIHDQVGKGPFKYNGNPVKVVVRPFKDGSGATYFLRGKSVEDMIEVS